MTTCKSGRGTNGKTRSTSAGTRVGFFGAFYPATSRIGPTTTGVVLALADQPEVGSVTVYAQTGSRLPNWEDGSKITVKPVWVPDSPASLLFTWSRMLRNAKNTDAFIFNIYLSVFGRSRIANGIGLLLPVLLSAISGKRTVVYMHNFLETQDIRRLGYQPSKLTKRLTRILERFLLRSCTVLVPLKSQSIKLKESFDVDVPNLIFPFVEGVCGFHSFLQSGKLSTGPASPSSEPITILLFGAWGPQKDLGPAIRMLDELARNGRGIRVKVAGEPNVNFPSYRQEFERARASVTTQNFEFLGKISEQDVPTVLLAADALFLPYNASGGYSAVMNLAALYGVPIIAYNLPEFQELANQIKAETYFVPRNDVKALERALRWASRPRPNLATRVSDAENRLSQTKAAVRELLEMIASS